MAANDEDENEERVPLTRAPSKKMGIFIAVGVLLLVIVGAGGVFAWMKFSSPSNAEQATTAHENGTEAQDNSVSGPVVGMAPFIVNLADAGTPRYLKVAIKLELNDNDAVTRLKDRIPRVRDSLLLLLSSQESEKMRGIKGKLRLKDQIFERVSVIVGEGSVRSVFLTDFVVQ